MVEPLEGDAVQIKCRPNTTIEDIKAQLEEKKGIPVDRQRLFFNGAELINPNSIRNLCRVEIVTLQLLHSSEQYVALRESCGKIKILKFYSDVTPLDILEKIKTKTSSIHSNCLMFQGRELDYGSSLGAQSIASGDTLHVVIKHRRQVYVRTFNGGITVPCSPHDTIRRLKAAIQMKEGIPSEHQHLLKFGAGMDEYEDSERVPLQHLPQLLVNENFVFIFVQGKCYFKVKYDPSETVLSVKHKIQRSMGIPPELQEMTFNGEVLDDGHQLMYYKVKNCDTLNVKELYQGPISVELITGGTIRVFIRPQDTVASVKEKLQEKSGIPKEKQRLFVHGRELLAELEYRSEFTQLLLVRRDSDIFYVAKGHKLCLIHVLSYNPHDTVKDIKLKLQETYESCQITLLFDGKTLQDSQELSKCGVCKESMVVFKLMPIPERYSPSFGNPSYCVPKQWPLVLINVKNGLTGKTTTVEAYPFHSIADLKAKIEVDEGFRIDQQRLLFADQELWNSRTLHDCNISEGCTLFLIPDSHKRCPSLR